ncbi:MAG: L-histidine N(alpha)-methyltransferase [Pseudomonadales bacterium]
MALDEALRERKIIHHKEPIVSHDVRAELLAGLQKKQKTISPKYFYDTHGSELFEQITRQPEYYPTRTEKRLLQQHSVDIAATLGADCVLIEPGSGSSEKVELLLSAVRPSAYVPIEISEAPLHSAAKRLTSNFPWLHIHAVCADYTNGVAVPEELLDERRVLFYPGSTIGNFEPLQAVHFLQRLRKLCSYDGGLLIGVDLQKDPAILHAAYNDANGVTAAFNVNVLRHINRVADANFDTSAFVHQALYNSEAGRIEMYLQSLRQQRVTIADQYIEFAVNERILTEYSYKYTIPSFRQIAAAAGFKPVQYWTDPEQLFSVHCFAVANN